MERTALKRIRPNVKDIVLLPSGTDGTGLRWELGDGGLLVNRCVFHNCASTEETVSPLLRRGHGGKIWGKAYINTGVRAVYWERNLRVIQKRNAHYKTPKNTERWKQAGKSLSPHPPPQPPCSSPIRFIHLKRQKKKHKQAKTNKTKNGPTEKKPIIEFSPTIESTKTQNRPMQAINQIRCERDNDSDDGNNSNDINRERGREGALRREQRNQQGGLKRSACGIEGRLKRDPTSTMSAA
jgi:hypothetical protein